MGQIYSTFSSSVSWTRISLSQDSSRVKLGDLSHFYKHAFCKTILNVCILRLNKTLMYEQVVFSVDSSNIKPCPGNLEVYLVQKKNNIRTRVGKQLIIFLFEKQFQNFLLNFMSIWILFYIFFMESETLLEQRCSKMHKGLQHWISWSIIGFEKHFKWHVTTQPSF